MDDIFAPSQNGIKHFATPFQVTKNWKEEPMFEDYLAKNAAQTSMQIVLDGAQRGTSQRYYDEMDTALADIVMDCVAFYLSPCKLTVTMVHSNIECQLAAYNLRRLAKGYCSFRAPRWEVVRRLIRDLDPFSVELARSGPVAALKKRLRPILKLGRRPIEVLRCMGQQTLSYPTEAPSFEASATTSGASISNLALMLSLSCEAQSNASFLNHGQR